MSPSSGGRLLVPYLTTGLALLSLFAIIWRVADADGEAFVKLEFGSTLALGRHRVVGWAEDELISGVLQAVCEEYRDLGINAGGLVGFQRDLQVGHGEGGQHDLEGMHGGHDNPSKVLGPLGARSSGQE